MTRQEFARFGSLELRSKARDLAASRNEPTTWTAFANREKCLDYLTGIAQAPNDPKPSQAPNVPPTSNDVKPTDSPKPAPKPVVAATQTPDAANVMAGLQALIAGAMASAGSVNADEVRRIVKETAVDKAALAKLVRELVADSDIVPPVVFKLADGKTIKVEGVQHPVTPLLASLATAGIRSWVHGPAGTGKTTTARQIAEAAGMAVFCQPPSLTRYDVLGYMDAHGKVVDTPVSRFVRADGPKCLLLDEVDSWGDGAQLAANLLLANGHAELPDGTMALVRDGSPSWIVATANTVGKGATSAYVGRKRMDGAFLDRFDAFPEMGLHEPTERKIAKGIILGCEDADAKTKESAEDAIALSVKIRGEVKKLGLDLSWSPRKTYALVKLTLHGMPTKQAVGTLLGATDKANAIMAAVGL